jgi:S1-C subfamily serine protease
MRMGSRTWRVWAGALGAAALVACQGRQEGPLEVEDVEAATVTLDAGHCAGVVVEDGRHALTAAHCVGPQDDARVDLTFQDGRRLGGAYVHVDRGRDVAVIRLDAKAPVRPLEVADGLPSPGDPLLFAGRHDRPGAPQDVLLERLDRCPSLPDVPAALFTTMRGKPGDSGAPLVDSDMRVVGLVHGGARCRIATPTAGLGTVVDGLARGGPALARKTGGR